MTDFTIDELSVPPTLDGAGADDFVTSIRVGNEIEAIGYGTPDLAYEPQEELPYYHDSFNPHRLLLARVNGQIVGRGIYETHTGEEADTAWLSVEVLPGSRGRGIGTALTSRLEQIARDDGKAKTLAYAPIQQGGGEHITAPTGFGSVPAGDRDVRFLLAQGYRLEQVERVSRVELPIHDLDDQLAAAQDSSGADYRVHYWTGPCPPRWREDYVVLFTRMSTDAPTAGLEEPEDVWTVDRLIEADERLSLTPRLRMNASVEHVPSGQLVGFTVLSVPPQKARTVQQYATLVLREHRGHRLGMLLKVANLVHLARAAPGHPSVITFNAEENRHMLSVNESMGFEPIAYESAWRKDLA